MINSFILSVRLYTYLNDTKFRVFRNKIFKNTYRRVQNSKSREWYIEIVQLYHGNPYNQTNIKIVYAWAEVEFIQAYS